MTTTEPAVMALTIAPTSGEASPTLSPPPSPAGPPGAEVRLCGQCGAVIVRRRRSAKQNDLLCVACDQRERRAAYFRAYYEIHKDEILSKNRQWAKDNRERLVRLRQARYARRAKAAATPRACIECGTGVSRALRCRRCYIRFRYATDPAYRQRRLATTRRWLERRTLPDEGRAMLAATRRAGRDAVQLAVTPN